MSRGPVRITWDEELKANTERDVNAAAAEFLRKHGGNLMIWGEPPDCIAFTNELGEILRKLGSGTDPDDRKEAGGG